MFTHLPSGRICNLYQDNHGHARLVAYVPHDKDWKKTHRQIRSTPLQALAAIRTGHLYVAVKFPGDRSRTLVHAANLK